MVHYLEQENGLGVRENATVIVGPRTTEMVFEPDEYTGAKNQVVIPGPEVDPKTMSTIVVEKESKGLAKIQVYPVGDLVPLGSPADELAKVADLDKADTYIVYAAGGSDVRHVFVSGQPLVQNRRLLTIDIREIMDRVNTIALEIRKPWI